MSELMDLALAHYEAMNRGDLDAGTAPFAEDVETTTPQGTMKGLDEFKGLGAAFLTAVPDMKLEIVRSFEDGDTIVIEGVYSGTQTGPLVGPAGTIPPSGNAFAFPYVDIMQAAGGKFVSHRLYWDNVTFLTQLGVVPA